jgi:hypothetical protein
MKRQRGRLRYTSLYSNENAAYLRESMLSYNGARFPIKIFNRFSKTKVRRRAKVLCVSYTCNARPMLTGQTVIACRRGLVVSRGVRMCRNGQKHGAYGYRLFPHASAVL